MKLSAASICAPRAHVLKCLLQACLSKWQPGVALNFPPSSSTLPLLFMSFIFGTCESTGGSKLGSHVLPGFGAGVQGQIPANNISSPVLFRRTVSAQYLYWELEFDAVV